MSIGDHPAKGELIMRTKLLIFIIVLAVAVSTAVYASPNRILIDDLEEGEIRIALFELSGATDLDIEAIGARGRFSDDLNAYAWILNSQTRDEVWRMSAGNTKGVGDKSLRRDFKGTVKLEKGRYEIYYYLSENRFSNITIDGAGEVFDFLKDLFSGKGSTGWRDLIEECRIAIGSNSDTFKIISQRGSPEISFGKSPLLQLTKVGDNLYEKRYFTLKEDAKLHVYMIGEYAKSGRRLVDGGWIIDLETRSRVWEPSRWNTSLAGGAKKNRVFNEEISLSAGDYALHYMTDNSHSFEEWNAAPPSDPFFWGITILPGEGYKKGMFEIVDTPSETMPLVALTKVGDRAYERQSFKLTKDAKLRVYCFGESDGGKKRFADYGWIEDNSTHDKIWELNVRNAEFSGGASKNKVFDGVISLPKGSYTVHYVTDGSHSYEDWNSSPPFDSENYGISIYGAGRKFNRKIVKLIDLPEDDGELLARLVRLGDDVKVSKSFGLKKPAKIHIYSIGEGDRHGMFDFGWIENKADRQVVWEMTYRNTKSAGGASKNRLFDADIMLDKGNYKVYFVTDGSHSFENWNSSKPRDPINWGIIITRK